MYTRVGCTVLSRNFCPWRTWEDTLLCATRGPAGPWPWPLRLCVSAAEPVTSQAQAGSGIEPASQWTQHLGKTQVWTSALLTWGERTRAVTTVGRGNCPERESDSRTKSGKQAQRTLFGQETGQYGQEQKVLRSEPAERERRPKELCREVAANQELTVDLQPVGGLRGRPVPGQPRRGART